MLILLTQRTSLWPEAQGCCLTTVMQAHKNRSGRPISLVQWDTQAGTSGMSEAGLGEVNRDQCGLSLKEA